MIILGESNKTVTVATSLHTESVQVSHSFHAKIPFMKIHSNAWAFVACMVLSAPFLHAQTPPPAPPAEPPIKAPATGLRLPSILGDHMVLQRDAKTPLWGWADPGETVTVTAGSATGTATADAKGSWRVDLQGLKSSSTPIDITISGKSKTITLHDVLIGDVWYCSGQSNMEIPLNYISNFDDVIAHADNPTLRLFIVFNRTALDPQDDCRGEWKVSTPESARGFSAIGYLFGKGIADAEHVPVGMIGAYSGGSWASSWISLEGLQADPASKTKYADPFLSAKALVPLTTRPPAGLTPDQAQAYGAAGLITGQWVHDQWYDNNGGQAYSEAQQRWHEEEDPIYFKWKTAATAARANGQPPPPSPTLPPQPTPPPVKEPRGGDGRTLPTMLFNGLLHPILPFAIKGVIWYQGESDRGLGTYYRTLFPQLIADWRQHWGEGNFPFIFVQLAGFTSADDTTNNNWSLIQEAQLMTLTASPNTGMAVANDIGDLKVVHPHDKTDLADRLVLAARHVAYGENLVYSGPLYDSFKVDGNKVHIKFKETGSGLKIGLPPAEHLKLFPQTLSPTLDGFVISGSDMNFVPATATIDGPDSVTVSSDQVTTPVAVRYSWGNVYGNLYNKEDLPASPFRTDPDTPAPSIKPPPKPKPDATNAPPVAPTPPAMATPPPSPAPAAK